MGERGLHCFGYLPHTFDLAVLGYTRLTFYDVQAAIEDSIMSVIIRPCP